MPFDENDDQQSGKSLRDRMEEALAEANTAKAELQTYKVRDLLTEKGFKHVKAEDLAGVPLEQVEAKAKEIQDKRHQEQRDLLKDVLVRQGVTAEGDDLEAMVTDLLAEKQAASPEADATRRAQAVGRAEGVIVPRVDPNQLHGFDALRAHFASGK